MNRSSGHMKHQLFWKQRDLEDQIKEEKQSDMLTSPPPLTIAQTIAPSGIPKVTVEEIKSLLKRGYTRYSRDDRGYGSIQSKYGLSRAQVISLFRHDNLIGLKTKFPGVIIQETQVEAVKLELVADPTEGLIEEDFYEEESEDDKDEDLFS